MGAESDDSRATFNTLAVCQERRAGTSGNAVPSTS